MFIVKIFDRIRQPKRYFKELNFICLFNCHTFSNETGKVQPILKSTIYLHE
ncbi:hypothetical protein IX321_001744 [Bacteroides pyogenes]|nr:hypothetical protein [Bacteroides pyogenes]MBR8757583.1 hypothetical protein [Bacteroides pyogenes]MBR8780842.1 hypothetical protein [Bacteroides pyogenes]